MVWEVCPVRGHYYQWWRPPQDPQWPGSIMGCHKTPPTMTVTCPSGSVLSEGYGVATASEFIDPAYDGDQDTSSDPEDLCTQQIQNGGNRPLFLHDSVVSNDFAAPNYPRTFECGVR